MGPLRDWIQYQTIGCLGIFIREVNLSTHPRNEASKQMMKALEALRGQVGRDGGSSIREPLSSSHASKATAAKSKPSPPQPQPNPGPSVAPELPETDAAKQARLRRLCERKPSGKINVPLALHEKWLKANRDERDAMVDQLDDLG